ncbi:hypothetical protein [Cellulomonas sp.]|uniref:hypothetical protein n=1 Tax=Cellulomonas sp. TaxID=40001 RepID=UPI001B28757D|nr:hypothetical protein [Cellulomonas sp.]MBO9554285.1 hypothetical protein [Cellulomonas sp.]
MTHPDQVPSGPPSAPPVAPPVAPAYPVQQEVGPAVERPASLTRAVQLMYVGAALSLVGIVIGWATQDTIRDGIAKSGTDLSADALDTAVMISLVLGTVVGLIGVGLWLWMAAANKGGRSWARVVATVFGGLNVVFTLYGFTTGVTPATLVSLVSVVLAVVILVLLWRPSSSEYYRARSAGRA